MIAETTVEEWWPLYALAQACGVADDEMAHGRRGRTTFWARVPQQTLDAAVAAYDPIAAMRDEKMAVIRAERNRRLQATDGPMLGAMETGADATALKAHRQALRDLPQTVKLDALATPEALRAFEPAWPE